MRLYLHIPFCSSKCPYCDFVSAPADSGTRRAYLRALFGEMDMAGASARKGDRLESLYCGGGTPSVYEPSDLARLLVRASELWGWADDAEVSVEINPSTWDGSRLEEAVAAGFNRLSIGVQSFDDEVLRALGRRHGAEQSRRLAREAMDTAGATVSLDLIFGVPGQAPGTWRRTLEEALELRPGHVSAYALTVEPPTPLGRGVAAGAVSMPPDETVAEMYDDACRLFASAGYGHYEISSFALPGKECRHNQAYWKRLDYLGLGAAAHSFRAPDARSRNTGDVAEYMSRLEAGSSPLDMEEPLSAEEIWEEEVFLSLRTAEGVDVEVLAGTAGREGAVSEAWKTLEESGLAWMRGSRCGLTEKGMFVSNDIIASLFPG